MKRKEMGSTDRLRLNRETLLDLSGLRQAAGGSTINSCNCATSTVHPDCTIVKPTTSLLC